MKLRSDTLRLREIAAISPTGVFSLFIAELFYKFHSFTLECLAFLATWYVADLVRLVVMRALTGRRASKAPA
jgi:hypothetical protein